MKLVQSVCCWLGGPAWKPPSSNASLSSLYQHPRALDLVATGFPKPARYYGSSITTRDELLAAAAAFKAQYIADMALAATDSSSGDTLSFASDDAATARGGAAAGGAEEGAGKVRAGCCGRPGARRVAAVKAAGAGKARAGCCGGGTSRESDEQSERAAARTARYPTGAWAQYRTLLWRELLSITRNPFDVAGRVLTFAWVGVFMGLLTFGTAVSHPPCLSTAPVCACLSQPLPTLPPPSHPPAPHFTLFTPPSPTPPPSPAAST